MNFKKNESATKLRGGYYTPIKVATFLSRWVQESGPKSILEPSCGDGAFVRALADLPRGKLKRLIGVELVESEARTAASVAAALPTGLVFDLHVGNFLEWYLRGPSLDGPLDAVLGNPPFIRYQYLEQQHQRLAEQVLAASGLPFTRHTNAWVPFLVASLQMLRPGGRLGMVIPSELLHVLHASSVRTFLGQHCSRILIIDPAEILFEDTLQGTILLLLEKNVENSSSSARLAVWRPTSSSFLSEPVREVWGTSAYTNVEELGEKWTSALLDIHERELIQAATLKPRVSRFERLASVDVGIVTGANRFFLVDDETVEQFQLQPWAMPMFGRSGHVEGVIYDSDNHMRNKAVGYPTNFLYFDGQNGGFLSKSALRYIQLGESEGLHRRFKCRIREPWFKVPSIRSAPIAMLKRSHDFPRLVANRLPALTTDTAYRIVPVSGVEADVLVGSFVNSLTALSCELEGRHYGGGVLELVPSEIERLIVPMAKDSDNLRGLHELYLRGTGAQDLLHEQDKVVLGSLGFDRETQEDIFNAWNKLSSRRKRIEVIQVDGDVNLSTET